MDFKITADFIPTGDQPQAIAQLSEGISSGYPYQTLLGVTGSGNSSATGVVGTGVCGASRSARWIESVSGDGYAPSSSARSCRL